MSVASNLRIEYRGGILDMVPAVHYRVPFAQAINRIVCDSRSRPEVIAVELGSGITAAAISWMRELGIGPGQPRILPCLLGLKERQRYLSPELYEKAIALQIETGLPLKALPAAVLDLELNYRSSLVMPISPTDSIVEALRCALELDIPVYGIDLDEHAPQESDACLFPDTAAACARVENYVCENAGLLNASTLSRVNQRREYAMAARLKELLVNNKKVLFTGGIGHWNRLAELIRAPEVLATTNIKAQSDDQPKDRFQRVVMHPSMAVQFLDRLPAVVQLYERQRCHPLLGNPKTISKPVRVPELFELTLRHGIRNYLQNPHHLDKEFGITNSKLNRIVDFPGLAMRYGRLTLDEVPSIPATLRCAKVFISESFAAALANTFFKFPWARADDYEDCETLLPSDRHGFTIRGVGKLAETGCVNDLRKTDWVDENGVALEDSSIPDSEMEKENGAYHFTWKPWEELITGLCDDAIKLSQTGQPQCMTEPFLGSMQGGIALKQTLGARARGDRTLQVYARPSGNHFSPVDPSEGWPVVWIFDSRERSSSIWSDLVVPLSWIKPYLDAETKPESLFKSSDLNLSSLICFEDKTRKSASYQSNSGVHASSLRGIIAFGPVFHHDQQYARWLELTRGLRNPMFSNSGLSGIPNTVSRHCKSVGKPLGVLRWQDDIIRMAIPYAGRQLTVVLPRHFRPDPEVYQEAAGQGKSLFLTSLDRFTASDVERAQNHLMVPGFANASSPQYALKAQSSIAENHKCFSHRMPEKWRRFGL